MLLPVAAYKLPLQALHSRKTGSLNFIRSSREAELEFVKKEIPRRDLQVRVMGRRGTQEKSEAFSRTWAGPPAQPGFIIRITATHATLVCFEIFYLKGCQGIEMK